MDQKELNGEFMRRMRDGCCREAGRMQMNDHKTEYTVPYFEEEKDNAAD